jgi:uncharacterized protein (DUF983 family)
MVRTHEQRVQEFEWPEEPRRERPAGLGWLCFGRVLRKRCPQCGVGRLFRSRFRLSARCEHCGLVYRREQGAQTGSMYLSTAVSEVFGALVIFAVWIFTDWNAWQSLAVGVPIVVFQSFAFLPYSMALWVAVEYLTDVCNREWWADPRP